MLFDITYIINLLQACDMGRGGQVVRNEVSVIMVVSAPVAVGLGGWEPHGIFSLLSVGASRLMRLPPIYYAISRYIFANERQQRCLRGIPRSLRGRVYLPKRGGVLRALR